jgi:hypothetical protein
MDGGFGHAIAQGGTNVSGGQKQRLSIARALVRRPEIYIFDDSFSALDFKTDAKLRAALTKYAAQSTVFIISQRVSTVMNADTILVLDEGRVAGIGKHRELLESCEIYREIAASAALGGGTGMSENRQRAQGARQRPGLGEARRPRSRRIRAPGGETQGFHGNAQKAAGLFKAAQVQPAGRVAFHCRQHVVHDLRPQGKRAGDQPSDRGRSGQNRGQPGHPRRTERVGKGHAGYAGIPPLEEGQTPAQMGEALEKFLRALKNIPADQLEQITGSSRRTYAVTEEQEARSSLCLRDGQPDRFRQHPAHPAPQCWPCTPSVRAFCSPPITLCPQYPSGRCATCAAT